MQPNSISARSECFDIHFELDIFRIGRDTAKEAMDSAAMHAKRVLTMSTGVLGFRPSGIVVKALQQETCSIEAQSSTELPPQYKQSTPMPRSPSVRTQLKRQPLHPLVKRKPRRERLGSSFRCYCSMHCHNRGPPIYILYAVHGDCNMVAPGSTHSSANTGVHS